MKINKDSWHYKVWNSTFDSTFDRYNITPTDTDLCRYCHRIFWRLVMYTFGSATLLSAIGILAWLVFYDGLFLHTGITLIAFATIGIAISSIVLYNRWLSGHHAYQEPTTLLGKYMQANKQRVCPIVEFESDK